MPDDSTTARDDAALIGALQYPLQVETILRKRKKLRRLLESRPAAQPVRIALLGGATTHELRELLELFLRARGLAPAFFESEYARHYEDAVHGNPQLDALRPQIAIVFTTTRNLTSWPRAFESAADIDARIEHELGRLRAMWTRLHDAYGCMVIQNNFEQ